MYDVAGTGGSGSRGFRHPGVVVFCNVTRLHAARAWAFPRGNTAKSKFDPRHDLVHGSLCEVMRGSAWELGLVTLVGRDESGKRRCQFTVPTPLPTTVTLRLRASSDRIGYAGTWEVSRAATYRTLHAFEV